VTRLAAVAASLVDARHDAEHDGRSVVRVIGPAVSCSAEIGTIRPGSATEVGLIRHRRWRRTGRRSSRRSRYRL
jgi:hypothetical protein